MLEVVVTGEKNGVTTTTTVKLALTAELPSIEEELKVLVTASKGPETGMLDESEVLRLRRISNRFLNCLNAS